MPSHTGDPSEADAARADLELLAAEVAVRGYHARLVARTGVRPYLVIRNPRAPVLTDQIYAEGEYFTWSWDQRLARRDEVTDAADKVARVLRAVDTLGTGDDQTAELQVRTREQSSARRHLAVRHHWSGVLGDPGWRVYRSRSRRGPPAAAAAPAAGRAAGSRGRGTAAGAAGPERAPAGPRGSQAAGLGVPAD